MKNQEFMKKLHIKIDELNKCTTTDKLMDDFMSTFEMLIALYTTQQSKCEFNEIYDAVTEKIVNKKEGI